MQSITVETNVQAEISKVWEYWTEPVHIMQWYFASSDWKCPMVENSVRVGGAFLFKMTARDGSASFDFEGTYNEVLPREKIAYTIAGGRKVLVTFLQTEGTVNIAETFEMENIHTEEQQRVGWQAILDNFKKHVETV